MMKVYQQMMNPQDIVILLAIIASGDLRWKQSTLAEQLQISQSEISKSLKRTINANLLDNTGKNVNRLALFEFLVHGIRYVFPQHPGAIVRGIPTAHTAAPLNSIIQSNDLFVWPSAKGTIKGQSIQPLYPSILKNITQYPLLYEMLTLIDAIRVGKAREKDIAANELKKRILGGEYRYKPGHGGRIS
jgi:DNA-binding Lrp family transcriptional regulator